MLEKEIINRALDNLEKNAHIKGKWQPIAIKELDGRIEFVIEGKKIKIEAEIKNNLRTIHLPKLFDLAKKHKALIVVAENIFPKIKEELRNHDIAYLEANGNIWLKYDTGLLWIDTNKTLPEEREKVNRAFTKTGLKVVFDFLRDETLINLPYREIANRAGIALGNVNYIMNGLKEKGFLLKMNKNTYKLTNKEELLNTWITKYGERLKPELEIGTFRFLKDEDFLQWKRLPLLPGKTWWGGEAGGDLYTNYLKPAVLTLYTTETRNELIRNYRLVPDPKGDIKVYQKFWTYDEDIRENNLIPVNEVFIPIENIIKTVAPPLLVYADLINTGDHRCIETAQKLYQNVLQNKF